MVGKELLVLAVAVVFFLGAEGVNPAPRVRTLNFETDIGAVAEDSSLATAWKNGRLLNETLARWAGANNSGTVLLVPAGKEFFVMGGIQGVGLVNFTLDVQGKVSFNDDIKEWPRHQGGGVLAALAFSQCSGLTVTGGFTEVGERAKAASFIDPAYTPPAFDWGSKNGVLDGQGHKWWGIPLIGYLIRGENRPRLMTTDKCTDVLVEKVYFRNSAYWTFLASSTRAIEVRESLLTAMRGDHEWMKPHEGIAMTAFNTDGFDFSGTEDIYVHDVEVWNQDDCICLKDNTKNVLVERVSASGMGLTIGSIGNSYSMNVTFRDCVMRETNKGIYLKFRGGGGSSSLIQDITYENVHIRGSDGWPIWIGPAQQSDSTDACAPHPCSLCWPQDPSAKCSDTYTGVYKRITLNNVTVTDARGGTGVIIGGAQPMQNVTLNNVVVKPHSEHSTGPWWKQNEYKCEHVDSLRVLGTTSPVPKC